MTLHISVKNVAKRKWNFVFIFFLQHNPYKTGTESTKALCLSFVTSWSLPECKDGNLNKSLLYQNILQQKQETNLLWIKVFTSDGHHSTTTSWNTVGLGATSLVYFWQHCIVCVTADSGHQGKLFLHLFLDISKQLTGLTLLLPAAIISEKFVQTKLRLLSVLRINIPKDGEDERNI